MPGKRLAVLLLLAALPPPAAAQKQCWICSDAEAERRKNWTESEPQLPAYPKPDNLIRFDAGAATPHRFYVDAPSLSVGEDGVVRYTLVVKTAGGATNVTFEGIRCDTREQKLYATGQREDKWVPVRDPQWRYIEHKDFNRHYLALYAEFFCGDTRTTSPKQMVDALKRASAQLR